jgi:hypothetical protein
MTFESALTIVNLLVYRGVPRDDAIANPAVPGDYRKRILNWIEAHAAAERLDDGDHNNTMPSDSSIES